VFATYKGEISDYYFSVHIHIFMVILAFITNWLWERKNIFLQLLLIAFWGYFAFTNAQEFFKTSDGTLPKNIRLTEDAITRGEQIQFVQGDGKSYLYYYFMYTRQKQEPYKL
jgi:hypothetical protein